MSKEIRGLYILVVLALIVGLVGVGLEVVPVRMEPVPAEIQAAKVADFIIPTYVATATPGVVINNLGVGDSFWVSDSSTPVVKINASGNIDADGDLDVDGTSNLDAVDIDAAVNVGATPAATATPQFLINDVGAGVPFEIRNASATPQVAVDGAYKLDLEGDLDVGDTLNVDGDIDLDGDGFDVNITAGFSIDGDAASNINVAGAGIDLTLESEAGRLVLKGDEAAADAIHLDANDAAGAGIDIDVGASGGLSIDGGVTNIGGGTPDVAAGDNDLYVTGDLEVDGEAEFDGTVDVDDVMNLIVGTEHIGVPTIHSTSITYTAAAGGSGVVATIGDGEIWFVHAVFVQTTTSFDVTGDDATLTVGDGNVAAGFLNLADASLQSTFTEATGFAAGWAGIENGSAGAYTTDDGGPFVYAPSGADETIDWVLDESSGETYTAGAATIYVLYTRIQ